MKQRALDLAPRLSVIDPGEARADGALTGRPSYIGTVDPYAGEPASQVTVAAGTPARSDIVVAVRDPYASLHDTDSLTNLRSARPSLDPDGESMTSPFYGGPSPAGVEPLAVDELKRYLFGDDPRAAQPAPAMTTPPRDETARRRREAVPPSEHTQVRPRPGVDTTAPLRVSSVAVPAPSTRAHAPEDMLPSMIIAPDPATRVPSSHAWARLTTKITRRPIPLDPSKPRPSGLVAGASVLFTTAALILIVAAFVRSNTSHRPVPLPSAKTTATAVRPPPSLVIAPPVALEPTPSEAAPTASAPATTVIGAKAKADRRGSKRPVVLAPTAASPKERSVEQMLEELGDEQLRR